MSDPYEAHAALERMLFDSTSVASSTGSSGYAGGTWLRTWSIDDAGPSPWKHAGALEIVQSQSRNFVRLAAFSVAAERAPTIADEVTALAKLQRGWNGYSAAPIDAGAITTALTFVQWAEELGVRIDRATPTTDSGVRLYFFSAARTAEGASLRYAALVIDGSGALLADYHDRAGGESRIDEVPEALTPMQAKELLHRLADFARNEVSAAAA